MGDLCARIVLIETLWNVKDGYVTVTPSLTTVLIETLWNVKRTSRFVFRILRSVLIETLWNVKMSDIIISERGTRY